MTAVDDALDRLAQFLPREYLGSLATVRDALKQARETQGQEAQRTAWMNRALAAEAEVKNWSQRYFTVRGQKEAAEADLAALHESRARDIVAHAQTQEAEVQRLRAERDGWKWPHQFAAEKQRADAAENRVRRLTEGLRGLFDEIGDPEDVDQDCRFCTGHYHRHDEDCVWAVARALLADSPPDECKHGIIEIDHGTGKASCPKCRASI